MPCSRGACCFGLLFLAGLALAAGARAQSPLGFEFPVKSDPVGNLILADLNAGDDGLFTALWIDYEGDPFGGPQFLSMTRFSSTGQKLLEARLRQGMAPTDVFSEARAAPGPGHGFAVFYTEIYGNGSDQLFGSLYPRQGSFRARPFLVSEPPQGGGEVSGAARLPSGAYFVLAQDVRLADPETPRSHVFARVVDRLGAPLTPYFRVDTDPQSTGSCGIQDLGVDHDGNAVVVWQAEPFHSQFEDPQWTAILGQRFRPTGERLGDPFLIRRADGPALRFPSVAISPQGDFVVVWQYTPEKGGPTSIRAQRFTKSGQPAGSETVVEAENKDGGGASAAMDAQGNFVVVWTEQTFPCVAPRGRLYRKDGTPVGPAFSLLFRPRFCGLEPRVAFGPQGVLAAAWEYSIGPNLVAAARFLASPGAEPCLARGGRVLCFTPTSGGEPVLDQTFGGGPDETVLIGDFDGDGRADLCTRQGTTFSCDLRHYGNLDPKTAVSFGLPGDVPLLGDVDGDGRADLCVRRGNLFLCDTRRQGQPDVTVQLGLPTDIPLLGDIDGDGRADFCVYRDGVFLCGGGVSIPFGQPGDTPALGDVDGDGRADPCVLHGGHLLCDTTHRGGRPDYDLNLHARPGDRLLIGNLDGL